MKKSTAAVLFFIASLLITACSGDDSVDKDDERPTVSIDYDDGFPQACTELRKGKSYNFRAIVTDNMALTSYSLDIHHNFDHHTHDDQEGTCELFPKKEADNPMIYMENFAIPGTDVTRYEIDIRISIPNDIDTGDYHCQYSVTDKAGWASRTSIDIKVIE